MKHKFFYQPVMSCFFISKTSTQDVKNRKYIGLFTNIVCNQLIVSKYRIYYVGEKQALHFAWHILHVIQGRIQDLIRGAAPDRDRPKTAILGPQFCRILVLGPQFWWSGGGPGPRGPPWIRPCYCMCMFRDIHTVSWGCMFLGMFPSP